MKHGAAAVFVCPEPPATGSVDNRRGATAELQAPGTRYLLELAWKTVTSHQPDNTARQPLSWQWREEHTAKQMERCATNRMLALVLHQAARHGQAPLDAVLATQTRAWGHDMEQMFGQHHVTYMFSVSLPT